MKSALILGLALAANAQVDNELATSLPYNPSGADLVRYAGQSRSQSTLPRHEFDRVVRAPFSRFDEVTDDELLVNLWSPSGSDLANHRGRPDTDKHGRPYTDMRGNPLGRPVYRDEVADDELATSPYTPYNPSGTDLVRNAGWGRHLPIPTRPTYSRFDDTADDELLVNPYNPSGADLANHRDRPVTDRFGRPYTDMRGNPLGRPIYRDEVADDELATSPYTPYNPSGADLVRNAGWGRHLPIPSRPTYSRFDEVTDDELLVNLWSPSGADLANHRGRPDTDKHGRPYTDMRGNPLGRPVYRDDEADSELAYLGQLIKETKPEKIEKKPEIKRHFRAVEKN